MKKKFKKFLEDKGISPEQYKAILTDDLEKTTALYNEFNESQFEILEKMIEEKDDSESVTKFKEEFDEFRNKEFKAVMDTIKELGLAMKAMKETPKGDEPLTLVKEVKDSLDTLKLISKRSGDKEEITLKALTTRASITDNEQAHDLTDIGQLATAKLSMMDIFPKITITGSNHNGTIRYYDWDEATVVRAANMIAEGAAFPESTAKFKQFSLPIQKIGDTLPVTEEFFEDEAMFASELEMFLRINVQIKINDQLINGDGTGTNLTGLVTSAPAFVPAASGISDASIYDLIVKVAESITATGGAKYSPNFAVLNIIDINQMRLKKDGNDNYILPPFVDRNGNQVAGMTIIEDNDVVANTMVVGDARFGRIYEIVGATVSRGFVGTQFTEDELTLKVRQRLALLIRDADKKGFSKVTDIAAALVTLAS